MAILKPEFNRLGALFLFILMGFTINDSYGQDPESNDSIPKLPPDSLIINAPDYRNLHSDIDETIKYFANDSIIFDAKTKTVKLYGGVDGDKKGLAHAEYGTMTLDAAYIEIAWESNMIYAQGETDSTGKYVGIPVFTDKDDVFIIDSMRYNTNRKRAIIYGGYTQQSSDQHLKLPKTYMNERNELFIKNGVFCPCQDKDASTYVKAGKIKVIPQKRVVTGPFQLWIADLPTPLFLPFGLFPISNKKSGTSGIIIPTYGESIDRGFFLRNGGYYWAMGDKADMSITGAIYTKGGFGINDFFNYKKRYKFSGNVRLNYNKRVSFSDEPGRTVTQDFWVSWRHTPVSRGGKRFTASIDAGTSTYNTNNSYSTDNYLSSSFKSNISFSSPIRNTPFNYSINLRHDQNILTNIYNFTLPAANLSMNRQNPFKKLDLKKNMVNDFLKSLNFSYRFDTRNQVSNAPVISSFPWTVSNASANAQDTLAINAQNFRALMDRAQFGMKHTIPVSASMKLGAFRINPTFNYNEFWYLRKFNYAYNPADSAIVVDTNRGLHRVKSFSTSANLTTRVYVTYLMKGKRNPKIRQILIPNISYTYRPDFGLPKYDYYQTVLSDTGTEISTTSRYLGAIYGTAAAGEQQSMGFSLNSSVEMKKDPKDSLDAGRPKTLIRNITLSSSYNFAAEEFKLAPISAAARTRVWKDNIDLNFTSVLDPYIYQLDSLGNQFRSNTYAASIPGQGLAKLTTANLSLSTSLTPSKFKRKRITSPDSSVSQSTLDVINANLDQYVDFSIPWSLNVSYNIRYSKIGFSERQLTQSLSFNGNLKLTEKWNVGFSSGYDFVNKTMTYTSANVYRDLGCWEMHFRWIPFGFRQSYTFDINIKSQLLKNLKLTRKRDWYDR